MTAVELDPIFVKALKLLHSRAKDSGAQLKSMLDDAIAHRKGLKVTIVDCTKLNLHSKLEGSLCAHTHIFQHVLVVWLHTQFLFSCVP